MKPQRYEIRIQGELGEGWMDWFDGLDFQGGPDETAIMGPMDHATLHGILAVVRDLGLRLISVRRLERIARNKCEETKQK